WDKAAKSWYVPQGADPQPFQRWSLERVRTVAQKTDPAEQFADALRDMGLVIKDAPVMDGQLYRVPALGDRQGQKSGAYVGHLDGQAAGFIENFKTGERRNWKSASTPALTEAERAQLAAESAAWRAERDEARQLVHDETVRLLRAHLEGLPSAEKDAHPYLARKDVYGHGVLLNTKGSLAISGDREGPQSWSAEGDLIVPIQNIDGQLVGAQSIDVEGRKFFPRGASWKGGFHVVGQTGDISAYDPARPVVIVEGFSTGATIYEKTNLPVVVAFTAGNLTAVAEAIRTAHPERQIIIAGDNDHFRERETLPDGRTQPNPGRKAAEKAAAAVGGFALLPRFEVGDKGSDWNDLAVDHGKAVFNQQWQAGMTAAERHFEVRRIATARGGQQEAQTPMQEQAREQPARASARR
ncbi:MAG: toprim domain-containing protein, partial [Alphaproteobacteria bacterium]